MKPGDPDTLNLSTLFMPARTSPSDPLAQRSYLAIKLTGALHVVVAADDHEMAAKLLRDTIADRVEAALKEAFKRPDETVVTMTGAC